MTLGWGIIGLGRSANTLVAPAIAADPASRLVAVVGRDQDRASAFAQRHGASTAGTDLAAILADPDLDVLAITSPNALHAEHAIAAARAGKHVFCDKPLATSVAEAEAILEACAGSGVRIGMNFQTRQHACFREARTILEQGDIGEIVAVQVDGSSGNVPFGSWRADPDLAGLGAVNNIAVHLYDLLRFLLAAEVTEVVALFDTGREEALERLPMVLMRFSNGTMAYANGNQRSPLPLNDIVIHGTAGRIDGRDITRPQREGVMRVITAAGERIGQYASHDVYERTVRAFSEAVLAGRDPDPSGVDGLRSVQLTEAIRRSAREGRLVQLGT